MGNTRGTAVLRKGQFTEKYEWDGEEVVVTCYLYPPSDSPIPVIFRHDRKTARRWWHESVGKGLTMVHLETEAR